MEEMRYKYDAILSWELELRHEVSIIVKRQDCAETASAWSPILRYYQVWCSGLSWLKKKGQMISILMEMILGNEQDQTLNLFYRL